jgi:Fe-S cluster assembly protein SufB
MAIELNVAVPPVPADLVEDYRRGQHDSEANYKFKSAKGLTREIVERISEMKGEPAWMRAFRC